MSGEVSDNSIIDWLNSCYRWFRGIFLTENIEPIKLARQLSVRYKHNGVDTMDDPNSYQGEERRQRANSLVLQCPNTGYADAFRKEWYIGFFQPNGQETGRLLRNYDPETGEQSRPGRY